ncbi:hypothetical protein GWI38_00500 [Staphylococcus schleiferi subsp. coagulans]|uniref:hypothetical protein n=1 Tax=Staphylococcus coagulans TaxID=74706 RepID=UPI0015F93745|nr:hypothetical protein [Staphylococcus coagulans]MBA8773118.1 hypothetical protein [Staphylococcus coagulans]
MKIKKQMTLLQLIEWAWDNGIKNKTFVANKEGRVKFDSRGWFKTSMIVEPDETFTVEVEEKITEETVIPMVLEVCEYCDGSLIAGLRRGCSIKEALDDNELMGITTHAFYILNDDASLTLIWKYGGVVE